MMPFHWLGADAELTMREYEEQRQLRREDDEEPADG